MTQYVIQGGDTLYSIARHFEITLEQLLAANPQILNPDKIYPGQSVIIPSTSPAPGMLIYIVVRGDTLFSIAQRYGTTVSVLLRLNPEITNASLIYPGQQIKVPLPGPPIMPGCIVYVSTRTGAPELWRSSASGENPVQLTGKGVEAQQLYYYPSPKWSPDGRRIAFLAMSGENRILYVMGPCGKGRTAVTSQDTGSYSWSPDSTMIAYSNSEGTFVVTPGGTASPRGGSSDTCPRNWHSTTIFASVKPCAFSGVSEE
jgi:LysM repeat protein